MKTEERQQLKLLLASFDETGLVALANKGLVRRAQKDLENASVQVDETDDALVVRGPGWTVWMPPAGPTHAHDDTKATGVTRQILAAIMYLRDHWSPGEAPAPSESNSHAEKKEHRIKKATAPPDGEALREALLALTLDDLQLWAGKTVVREVLALLPSPVELQIECHVGLTLRLVQHSVEVRLLPGPGKKGRLLERMLSTAPKALHHRWVVTAIIAFHQKHGKTLSLPDGAPAESSETPRSRADVLRGTQELLTGMLSIGIAHPSPRMIERLFTLSVSATAVHLPRLARLLRALADEVSKVLARDAAADTQRLFEAMCWTCALAKALQAAGAQPSLELAGVHRTQYDSIGDTPLAGIGAYPWQTASGYEGLTVLFWDLACKRFVTWTTSRPTTAPGRFQLDHVYRFEAVWSGAGSPERLCRSHFLLHKGRANPHGRLSGGQQPSVSSITPTDPSQVRFSDRLFKNWQDLQRYILSIQPMGLRVRNPLDRIVVLEPSAWGERSFDELQQCFCWPLQDVQGQTLVVSLAWNGLNEGAIEFLEAVKPSRDRLVRMVARVVQPGFLVEPLSLLSAGSPRGHYVLNPAFDQGLIETRQSDLLSRLRKKFGKDRIPTTMTTDDDWDDLFQEPRPDLALPSQIELMLSEVEVVLLQLAETGIQRLPDKAKERLKMLAAAMVRTGLSELGESLQTLASERPHAEHALWSGYMCSLHRQAAEALTGV